jgi:CubicO group peptidase (beta-lactamase class C family)
MYATLSFLPSIIWGTDDSFLSLVEKHIFEPLALNETTWDRNQLIHGFSRVGDFPRPSAEQGTPSQEDVWEAFTQGKPLVWPPEVSVEGDIVAGAGGVISSARDMVCLSNPLPRYPMCVTIFQTGHMVTNVVAQRQKSQY